MALVALACLVFQFWMPSTHVAESDYRAVAKVLSEESKAGDVVLLHPWWTDRARMYLPDGLQVEGHLTSDTADFKRNARIWVVAEPHLPRAAMSRFLAQFSERRSEIGAPRDFGNLELRLFNNGRMVPLTFSAARQLADVAVSLRSPDGNRTPCRWDGSSHVCDFGQRVTVATHEVFYAPYRCLMMSAPGNGTSTEVELSPESVRGSQQMVLQFGLLGESGFQREDVSDAMFTLKVAEKEVTETLVAGDRAMHTLTLPIAPEGEPVRARLTVDKPGDRTFCVVLEGERSTQ